MAARAGQRAHLARGAAVLSGCMGVVLSTRNGWSTLIEINAVMIYGE
jgi:hypothetical protein